MRVHQIKNRLVHRADDNLEAIKSRIDQYKANVNAVRGYFRCVLSSLERVGEYQQHQQHQQHQQYPHYNHRQHQSPLIPRIRVRFLPAGS